MADKSFGWATHSVSAKAIGDALLHGSSMMGVTSLMASWEPLGGTSLEFGLSLGGGDLVKFSAKDAAPFSPTEPLTVQGIGMILNVPQLPPPAQVLKWCPVSMDFGR